MESLNLFIDSSNSSQIFSSISILIAIASFTVAVGSYLLNRHRNRISDFEGLFNLLSRNRFIYSEQALKHYAEKHMFLKEGDRFISRYLLVEKPEWLTFVELKDVKVITDSVRPEYDGKRYLRMNFRLTPDRFTDYVLNVRRYLGKSIFSEEVLSYSSMNVVKDDDTGSVKAIQFNVCPTTYYDYQNTVALRELYCVQRIEHAFNRSSSDDVFQRHIDKIFDNLEPYDYHNRPVVIGACSLCFFSDVRGTPVNPDLDERHDYMLYHIRNGQVMDARNTVSMVPAGALTRNGTYEGGTHQRAFLNTIIREFEEEVLGCSEVEWSDKYTPPEVLINSDCVHYYYIGTGLDPLNLKMEAMSMIVIEPGKDIPKLKAFIESRIGKQLSINNTFTYKDLETITGMCSIEGQIKIMEVNDNNLLRMMNNKEAMPVFREALYQVYSRNEIKKKISDRLG